MRRISYKELQETRDVTQVAISEIDKIFLRYDDIISALEVLTVLDGSGPAVAMNVYWTRPAMLVLAEVVEATGKPFLPNRSVVSSREEVISLAHAIIDQSDIVRAELAKKEANK